MTTSQANICVYCASSTRVDPRYLQLANHMGRLIAQAGHTLIWGGGSVGLMGEVAKGVHQQGGKVVGVIPQFMIDKELAYHACDELVVTDTMRQRKQAMEERSDFFIVLPGGFGTLEEFFEILTLRILDCHAKPILVVNDCGFYDELLAFIEKLYQQQFAHERHRACYQVVPAPDQAIQAIASQLATWPTS